MSSFATGRGALSARLCWVARLETAPTGFGPSQAAVRKKFGSASVLGCAVGNRAYQNRSRVPDLARLC